MKMKLNRQLFLLLAHEAVRGFRIAGAVWVLLLVGRGFSLAAVGVAEGVFHIVSMLFEVPSGMLADILGRRRTLIAAGLVNAAAGVAMAASRGLFGVCAAMALEALSFNLASGTLEALTYDTLAENGQEARYIRQTSRQYTLYSAAQSAASLMSVFTIRLGFAAAYLLSSCVGLGCAALGGLLKEPALSVQARPVVPLRQMPRRLALHALENMQFLIHRRRLAARMLCISLVGAAGYLTQMFWQQGLVDAGLPAALVGMPLFLLTLADVPGALLAPRLPARLGSLFLWCGLAVAICTMLAGSACLPLCLAGAVGAGFLESAFTLRADSLLQPFYPSASRATLTSVDSMMYSICMAGLSPLAGAVAGKTGAGACIFLIGAALFAAIAVIGLLRFIKGRMRRAR